MDEPTHKDVLEFVQRQSSPFVTTGDVADEFESVTKRTIRSRLHDLADRGDLQRRQIGPHAKVWYLPD